MALAAAAGAPSLLTACSSGTSGSGASGGGGGGGGVSWGTNESGTTFAKQFQAEAADFTQKNGMPVSINAVEHNTFQENINNYLQGSPRRCSRGSPATG